MLLDHNDDTVTCSAMGGGERVPRSADAIQRKARSEFWACVPV